MSKNILLIDSDYDEANEFLKGLEDKTKVEWEIGLYENNKKYGAVRYIRFFLVAIKIFCQRKKYTNGIILCWQQFYGIALAFLFRLFKVRKRCKLVIMTFIFKPKSGFLGKLFKWFVYYSISSKYVDAIICTSKAEISLYAETFGVDASIFNFVKWGVIDYSKTDLDDEVLNKQDYLFSTGRSNRDYKFLIDSLNGSKYKLVIACDTLKVDTENNIEIHDDIFGMKMLKYMKNSFAVVISLADDSIAAGQLVLLHALNLGKPVIITKSQGVTDDYIIDGYNGIVIEKDGKELLNAIEKLKNSNSLYREISNNGKQDFQKNYTKYILGKSIGEIICFQKKEEIV